MRLMTVPRLLPHDPGAEAGDKTGDVVGAGLVELRVVQIGAEEGWTEESSA